MRVSLGKRSGRFCHGSIAQYLKSVHNFCHGDMAQLKQNATPAALPALLAKNTMMPVRLKSCRFCHKNI